MWSKQYFVNVINTYYYHYIIIIINDDGDDDLIYESPSCQLLGAMDDFQH